MQHNGVKVGPVLFTTNNYVIQNRRFLSRSLFPVHDDCRSDSFCKKPDKQEVFLLTVSSWSHEKTVKNCLCSESLIQP